MKGGSMNLNVSVQKKTQNCFIVSLEGSLDTNTHTLLQEKIDEILKETPETITLDMEKLDYISSIGVRVVIKTGITLKKNNGSLFFVNMKPQIRKVFDIINALPLMKVFTSIQELDQYLDTMQKKVVDEINVGKT
jgi:anti-sigma B factor antagonist